MEDSMTARSNDDRQRRGRRVVYYPAFTWDYYITADGQHGYGLVARRNIKKGKLVLSDSLEYTFSHIDDGDNLILYGSDKASRLSRTTVPPEFPLSHDVLTRTHGIPTYKPDSTGKTGGTISWVLEVPGLFMNHSCSPNINPKVKRGDGLTTDYDKAEDHASTRIRKGEELTTDYALQYYDHGPFFEKCSCGAGNCRGEMMGFKALCDEDKEKLLPKASDAVRAMHQADMGIIPPLVFEGPDTRPPVIASDAVDIAVPEVIFPGPSYALADIAVKRDDDNGGEYAIYALRDFSFGERVYEFWCQPWPSLDGVVGPIDIVFGCPLTEGDPPEGEIVRVDPELCASRDREGRYVFSGWDLLTAHSCEPNLVYTDKKEDEEDEWRGTYAARDIRAGEKLSVDFNCLLWDRRSCAPHTGSGDEDVASGLSLENCKCSAVKCTGTREGFKSLRKEAQEERKMMSWKRQLPPFKEESEKVTPGEALSPHIRVSWRQDPECAIDAPDTDSDDFSSSSSESDTE